MRRIVPSILLIVSLAWVCAWKPVIPAGGTAPGGGAWVQMESVEPIPGTDQLLSTVRLRLFTRGQSDSLTLLDGVPDLCGIDIRWLDNSHLALDVPEEWASRLNIYDGEQWGGVALSLKLDRHQIKMERDNPDGSLSLVVISQCETGHWNLYLRKQGEPDYVPAMQTGWSDPQLLGGFSFMQPIETIDWTGRRSACVVVAYQQYGVMLKSEVQGVHVEWVFDPHYKRAPMPHRELSPLKESEKWSVRSLEYFIKRLI